LVKATGADALRLQRSRTLLSVFCQGTLCFWRFLPERMSANGGSGAIALVFLPQRAQRIREGRKTDHGSTVARKAKTLPLAPQIKLLPSLR